MLPDDFKIAAGNGVQMVFQFIGEPPGFLVRRHNFSQWRPVFTEFERRARRLRFLEFRAGGKLAVISQCTGGSQRHGSPGGFRFRFPDREPGRQSEQIRIKPRQSFEAFAAAVQDKNAVFIRFPQVFVPLAQAKQHRPDPANRPFSDPVHRHSRERLLAKVLRRNHGVSAARYACRRAKLPVIGNVRNAGLPRQFRAFEFNSPILERVEFPAIIESEQVGGGFQVSFGSGQVVDGATAQNNDTSLPDIAEQLLPVLSESSFRGGRFADINDRITAIFIRGRPVLRPFRLDAVGRQHLPFDDVHVPGSAERVRR